MGTLYGFEFYLAQEIHCVKTYTNGKREKYRPDNYTVRDREQAKRDDGALAEGRLGIELLTGQRSNVIALDIESDELANDQEFNRYVPLTDCVKIGSKGETRFYLWQGELSEQFYDGETLSVELLSDNGPHMAPALCMLPPSIHPKTGKPYYFIDGVPLYKNRLEPLPASAIEYLRQRFTARGPAQNVQQEPTTHELLDDSEGLALHEYPFLVDALRAIDPDIDYHRWYQLAMGVRYALGCKVGRELFSLWSRGGLHNAVPNKCDDQASGMIGAFFDASRHRTGTVITHATVYSIAKAFGSTVTESVKTHAVESLVESVPVSAEDTDPMGKPTLPATPSSTGRFNVGDVIPTLPGAVQPHAALPHKIAALPKPINYRDHHAQVAKAFVTQGAHQSSVLLYANTWYAYSPVRNLWWELADAALIDRRIEQYILDNGYNWLPDKDSKTQVEIPIEDADEGEITDAATELVDETEQDSTQPPKKRGRPKKKTRTITQYDKVPCIDIKQRDLTEVRNAVGRLIAREAQVRPNKWLDDINNVHAPDCIAVENGILDIRTGSLYAHTPHFFNTSVMPVSYPGTYVEGMCPLWLESLNMYFGGEQSCIDMLQLAFGYTLLSDLQHKKIFVLKGDRHSGKTTITNILGALLGEGNILTGSNDTISSAFGAAGVDKTKMLLLEEFSLRSLKSREIDALKRLSGGGAVNINEKFEKAYSAYVTSRVWITTNDDVHKYEDSGRALSDRMTFWQCQPIPDEQMQPNFEHTLLSTEGPGILSWAIEGGLRLLAGERIRQPGGRSAILKDTFTDAGRDAYRTLLDDCIVYDPQQTGTVSLRVLYSLYCTLATEHAAEHGSGAHHTPQKIPLSRFAQKLATSIQEKSHLRGAEFVRARTASEAGLRFVAVHPPSLV